MGFFLFYVNEIQCRVNLFDAITYTQVWGFNYIYVAKVKSLFQGLVGRMVEVSIEPRKSTRKRKMSVRAVEGADMSAPHKPEANKSKKRVRSGNTVKKKSVNKPQQLANGLQEFKEWIGVCSRRSSARNKGCFGPVLIEFLQEEGGCFAPVLVELPQETRAVLDQF